MLDRKYIINNIDEVIKKLNNRQSDFCFLNQLVKLSKQKKEFICELEKLKNNKNTKTKDIKYLIYKNDYEEVDKIKNEIFSLKKEINLINGNLINIEKKINNILEIVPNVPDETVPIGKSEDENVEIKKWGVITNFKNCKNHIELASNLDIIDFKRGVKISGNRFIIYKGIGAKLERALLNFMLDQHSKEGYIEVLPPVLVKPSIMYGAGNLPKFSDDAYFLKKDNLYLIPTSEVPLVNMYCNEILLESQLPIYHCAYTPCFRQEAGSHGKDTKGIIRLHQFNKVEMVKITSPNNSVNELNSMVKNSENILKMLKIPYRVIMLCTGDIGFTSSKTYDIELWMPSEKKYREVSSCSNCKDFQARRMKMKYRSNNGDLQFVHTLNGSGLAIDRVIAAILENYQNDDGTVGIPKVLWPYLNGITIIK